jgi:lysyl-tRNA synthetase class 2
MTTASAGDSLGSVDARSAIRYKADVVRHLRQALHDRGFVELFTPVVRRWDDGTGKRPAVDLLGPKQLRSMIGPTLRFNLQFHPRIFEIGPCFRPDATDGTHAPEFWMLDLYVADESYEFLVALAKELVAPFVPFALERISVAQRMRRALGVDLFEGVPDDLAGRISSFLSEPVGPSLMDLIDRFIAVEIEPMTVGGATLLCDYPVGGSEPCARRRPSSAGVLNRFELFVDGVEVVHGYEDEPDADAFVARAVAAGLYNEEQAIVHAEIAAGRVPAHSVGLGLGIERLCMAATGVTDISVYRQSLDY